MNIHDYEAPEVPDTWAGVVHAIFARQCALMEKYKEIEGLPSPPLSLHHASGQRVLKDFAWRVVEELAESYEALHKQIGGLELNAEHQREELADALHFLVELLIFAGVSADACVGATEELIAVSFEREEDATPGYWFATYELGVAMNFLKNKPWKQHQMPTDEPRFRAQLLKAFHAHVGLWRALGLTMQDMHNYYFRKSEVNRFRQRSNY